MVIVAHPSCGDNCPFERLTGLPLLKLRPAPCPKYRIMAGFCEVECLPSREITAHQTLAKDLNFNFESRKGNIGSRFAERNKQQKLK